MNVGSEQFSGNGAHRFHASHPRSLDRASPVLDHPFLPLAVVQPRMVATIEGGTCRATRRVPSEPS
jgi:hypothetical protein